MGSEDEAEQSLVGLAIRRAADPSGLTNSSHPSSRFFAYDANYLIDNRAGIIVDAEGTRANRTDGVAVTQTMLDRVQRRFHIQPRWLAGDTAYGRGAAAQVAGRPKDRAAHASVGQVGTS